MKREEPPEPDYSHEEHKFEEPEVLVDGASVKDPDNTVFVIYETYHCLREGCPDAKKENKYYYFEEDFEEALGKEISFSEEVIISLEENVEIVKNGGVITTEHPELGEISLVDPGEVEENVEGGLCTGKPI